MYSALHPDITQGDIFNDVPIAYIVSQSPESYEAKARPVRVMLLSHSCEYDKPPKNALVAQVRLLSELNEENHEAIRTYRQYNTFYLPEIASKMQHSFVDFRYIGFIPKTILQHKAQHEHRVISLDEDGIAALQRQIANAMCEFIW